MAQSTELDDIKTSLHELSTSTKLYFDEQNEIRRKADDLYAHMFGSPEKVGVDERIRRVERFVDNQRKITWLIVPPVILGALAMVVQTVLAYQSEIN